VERGADGEEVAKNLARRRLHGKTGGRPWLVARVHMLAVSKLLDLLLETEKMMTGLTQG
jgi:hypothetical protein